MLPPRREEIGNEPDFYVRSGLGYDSSWTRQNYSDTWRECASAVSKAIKLDKGGTTYSASAFATGSNYLEWNTGATLEAVNMADSDTRSKTSHFAEQQYSGAFGARLAQVGQLMNKGTIRGNLSTKWADVKAARSNGLSFILGETNSYANHGMLGISNTAETAIWATDYILQAASMGIERLHFHHGFGYRYNLFQPASRADDGLNITSRAHSLPSYHSFLIVNEAIGTSGKSSGAELGTTNSSLSAYGIWGNGKLARMVLINSAPYASVNGTLPSRNSFSVNLANWKDESYATVNRLSQFLTHCIPDPPDLPPTRRPELYPPTCVPPDNAIYQNRVARRDRWDRRDSVRGQSILLSGILSAVS
ncbi:hypothetical protein JCM24511_04277 [Saitozyma sp. JCM 24511]|nr:hypothetical protein JCM24511_04277 [Saitozyma sp. JCM 24511]